MFTLNVNSNNIAFTKAINHIGKLFPNEIEITKEQYNQMNEFPYNLIINNGQVIGWEKTELPIIVAEPIINEDVELANNIASATTLDELKNALLGKSGIVKVKGTRK